MTGQRQAIKFLWAHAFAEGQARRSAVERQTEMLSDGWAGSRTLLIPSPLDDL
jgi:hypothetical protein